MVVYRKGSILDIPLIIIIIFAFAFIIIISTVILTEFRDLNTEKELGLPTNIINIGLGSLSALDYMFIFAAVGLGMATVVMAFKIRTHPIMFFFLLLLTAIFVIITTFFTDAFVMITQASAVSTIAADFPLINTVMENLPLIIAIIGFIIIIAMFLGKKSDVGM